MNENLSSFPLYFSPLLPPSPDASETDGVKIIPGPGLGRFRSLGGEAIETSARRLNAIVSYYRPIHARPSHLSRPAPGATVVPVSTLDLSLLFFPPFRAAYMYIYNYR